MGLGTLLYTLLDCSFCTSTIDGTLTIQCRTSTLNVLVSGDIRLFSTVQVPEEHGLPRTVQRLVEHGLSSTVQVLVWYMNCQVVLYKYRSNIDSTTVQVQYCTRTVTSLEFKYFNNRKSHKKTSYFENAYLPTYFCLNFPPPSSVTECHTSWLHSTPRKCTHNNLMFS